MPTKKNQLPRRKAFAKAPKHRTKPATVRAQRMVSSRLIACVPHSWLDPLLTGPIAVMKNEAGKWGCLDIERLLTAIRERMTKAANERILGAWWRKTDRGLEKVRNA